MGDPKDMGNPKEIDQFLPFEEEPIKTRYKAKSVVKLGTVFCTFLILAWLAWLTFDKKDVIPVRSDQDLIMERILEDKMVEMDRVMESVRAMKEGINATGFRQMRSVGTCANPVKVMTQSGQQMARTLGVIKDVILAPLQAAIDALEEKIRKIQNRINGMTEEQKRRILKALRKLSQVQRDLVIARKSLVNLASSTIKRVNSLIQVISEIGTRRRGVDVRVNIWLTDFDSLLENSMNMLKTALDHYTSMSNDMIEIESELVYFGESVMKQVEKRMETQMNSWIKKARTEVYAPCAFLGPLCFAVTAPILETRITKYKAKLADLKALSRDCSQESRKLAKETKKNKKYIQDEMILLGNWQSQIKTVCDSYTDTGVFTGDIDLVEYIEIEGKEESVRMLCDLSKMCTQYMEQNLKYAALKERDIPPQHRLCTGSLQGAELLQPITATLSSQYGHYPATMCIDGDTGNMCHSGGERSPWLVIDYGTTVLVKRVEIFNREDCCGERTKNVEVRISNELPTSASQMFSGGSLLGQFAGPATNGQHIIISGPTLSGRYVIVQMDNGEGVSLNLKEVTAFGEKGFELLQPLTATLSSTYTDWKLGLLQAAKCIDGDTEGRWQEGNMCHTEFEPAPWLAIDYGTSVTVGMVEIFNRDGWGDRTRNVDVRISNELPSTGSLMFSGGSLLGHFTGPAADGQKITISGQGLSGRYVIVQMDNGNLPLNLREVTAYGIVG